MISNFATSVKFPENKTCENFQIYSTFLKFSSILVLASSISVTLFWKATSTVSHCSLISLEVSSRILSMSCRSCIDPILSCSARTILSWENWAQDSGVDCLKRIMKRIINHYCGASFQDYSWIQDFEADFPQTVSLKSWIKEIKIAFLIYFQSGLKTIGHLNLNFWIFSGHIASFKIRVLKFQDFGNFELSPMSLN